MPAKEKKLYALVTVAVGDKMFVKGDEIKADLTAEQRKKLLESESPQAEEK